MATTLTESPATSAAGDPQEPPARRVKVKASQAALVIGVGIAGSRPVSLEQSLIATGFGYRVEQRRAQGAVVAGLLPRVRDIRRYGSAALDLCAAAAGRVDAYYELDLKPWDHAAGALIAAEAGLVVAGLSGRAFADPMAVVVAASIAPDFLDLLEELHADC